MAIRTAQPLKGQTKQPDYSFDDAGGLAPALRAAERTAAGPDHSDAGRLLQLVRRKGRAWVSVAGYGCAVLIALALASPAAAQQPIPPGASGDGSGMPPSATTRADRSLQGPAVSPQMEHHMAERRNSERQKQLVADTDRLLTLVQQLKQEVDKTDKDQLSVDVVKRAEQIEKLARTVKEKMRGN